MTPNLMIVKGAGNFPLAAAEWIADKIADLTDAGDRCSIALAGGATPAPVYKFLARPGFSERIDWTRIDFYFGDERCVPPDHPDSNYRAVREALFSSLPVEPEQIRRIPAERPDRDRIAADYEALLPERLDLVMLGMGEDGHTASLFPGSPALDEKKRRVVAAQGPKPPPWRISITPPVIAESRTVLVLVSGRNKASMVALALRSPTDPRKIPIQLALRGTWIIDSAAAGEL
jgi:6-phosphogluconolactonase